MENFTNQKLSVEIENAITQLEYKIVELKTLKIEPDLSYLNLFYKERTEENINRLNSRIKIPKLSLYIWISSFVMLVFSFLVFLYVFSKIEETKANSIKEYKNQLSKSSVIVSKENAELLKDMDLWFKSDPQSTSKFIHWRQNQK